MESIGDHAESYSFIRVKKIACERFTVTIYCPTELAYFLNIFTLSAKNPRWKNMILVVIFNYQKHNKTKIKTPLKWDGRNKYLTITHLSPSSNGSIRSKMHPLFRSQRSLRTVSCVAVIGSGSRNLVFLFPVKIFFN